MNKCNWVVDIYKNIDEEKVKISSIHFGKSYRTAFRFYKGNKVTQRKLGKYLELKPN